jgi:lipopolysaccharide export system permease protein
VAQVVMSTILTRYVVGRVVAATVLVATLLVGIYTVIEFLREARSLEGEYGLVQVTWYLLQTTPRRLYDVFPFAALIGALMGMGALASGNELVAMRAAGFDRTQLALRALLAVGICLVALIWLADQVVPGLEASAQAERQQARSGQVPLGRQGVLWLRDGEHVVRVGHSAWISDNQLEFGEVHVYVLDEGMRPRRVIVADHARHDGQSWLLNHAVSRPLSDHGVAMQHEEIRLDSGLSTELFAASVSRPRMLSMRDLRKMMEFLHRNDLDVGAYEQAFWGKVMFPIYVLSMVLVGLPFVFRHSRKGGYGLSLFAGVSLGLLFFVAVRLAQGMAVIAPIPMWLSSLFPALLIVMLAGLLLKRG